VQKLTYRVITDGLNQLRNVEQEFFLNQQSTQFIHINSSVENSKAAYRSEWIARKKDSALSP